MCVFVKLCVFVGMTVSSCVGMCVRMVVSNCRYELSSPMEIDVCLFGHDI